MEGVLKKYLPLLVGCTLLQACGGGGGGGTPLTYTSYAATAGHNSSKEITFNGSGASTSYSNGPNGSLSVNYTMRSDGLMSYANLSASGSPSSTQTFDTNNGDSIATFTQGALAVRGSDGAGAIFHTDGTSFYGVWDKKLSSNSWRIYAGGAGPSYTANPSSVVSSATYRGYALGVLNAIGYSSALTIADFSATANFSAGTMSVASTNTIAIDSSGNNLGSYAGENFSGTLSNAGQSAYTYVGTVSSSGTGSGTATLGVYGSSANSVAGDAVLTNGGNSRTHIVSFGGTR